jgi:hypothetical protein
MSGNENKQSGAEMARVLQQLEDETLIFQCEDGARGILENPQDARHAEAHRLLELRPAIRRRTDLGLSYNDLMTEFRDLCDSVRQKKHQARSRPKTTRKPKEWATILAAEVDSWLEIPDSAHSALEVERLEFDLRLYRDGKRVVCLINDGEGTKTSELAKSTFEKYYLRPSLKKRG